MAILSILTFAGSCTDESMDGGPPLAPDSGGSADLADAASSFPDAEVLADAAPSEADAGEFPVELACSLDEVTPIVECVADNCLDSLDNDLLTCVTLSCGLLLLTLPPDCSQCIFAGLTDTSMVLDACVAGLDDLGLPPLPQP